MLNPVLFLLASCAPQAPAPTSQPTSRPAAAPTSPAEWGESAPGRQVVPVKFAPIRDASYASARAVAERVTDEDLVIGLVVGERAVAYPINMLGGPDREIINEEFAGIPFCVNW